VSKNWLLSFCVAVIVIATSLFFFVFIHHQRQQSHLYVGVSGGNASVRMNHYDLGETPIKDATLPPGWYDFTLKTDYYNFTLPLRLSPQTATVADWQLATDLSGSSGVFYELTPIHADQSLLTVVTMPEKAQLSLDGTNPEQPDISPLIEKEMTTGVHTLHVSLPGYESRDIPLTLTPGYELKVTVKLAQSE